MAKSVSSNRAKLSPNTIKAIAAVLVIVLVIGVFAVIAHGKAAPSKEQAASETQKAIERAAELVNSGQAAGKPETTEKTRADK